jgi:4-amino-4-deoxy-L-arabinose transferase-like glycosyltransferase
LRRLPARGFPLLAAAAATLLLFRLGGHPLLDPDEARFARTSVEMMRAGELVVPTFEGAPRLVKPPLLHWMQIWLFQWWGPTEFAARLPAAASTFVSFLLVGWIARRRLGERGAFWAAAMFLAMPLVFVMGRAGSLDALLSVHVLAAIALDMAAPARAGAYRAAAIGALVGLAFLAKGPVAIVLVALVLLAGRTAAGMEVVPTLRATAGAVAGFAGVVFPWALAFAERIGPGATADLLWRETAERYFGSAPHAEPPWYFAKIATVAFAPWVGPIALGTVRALFGGEEQDRRTARYAAAGLIAGLLFFSIGRGKLPNYILPLAPLGALVAAWELEQELAEPRRRRLGYGLVAAWLVAVAVAVGVLGPKLGGHQLAPLATASSLVLGAGAAAALAGVGLERPRFVYGSAAASMGAFYLLAVAGAGPTLAATLSSEPVVREVPELSSPRPIVVTRSLPSLTFYLDRIPERVPVGGLSARLDRDDDALYVLSDKDRGRLPRAVASRLRVVGRAGKYTVFEEVDPARAAQEGALSPLVPR